MQMQLNGERREVPPDWRDESLLWVLREAFGLVGTKYGCGQGQCGACTVWVDGVPQRACPLPVSAAAGRAITTIEGLAATATGATPPRALHPVQQAWIDERVPQCGYCQAGQLMAAAALLAAKPLPDEADIDAALADHLCRCGTQPRVRRAILRAAAGGERR